MGEGRSSLSSIPSLNGLDRKKLKPRFHSAYGLLLDCSESTAAFCDVRRGARNSYQSGMASSKTMRRDI